MRIEGVKSVFFGDDFVTITKEQEDEDWAVIKPHVFAALMDYLQSGKPVLAEDVDSTQEPTDTSISFPSHYHLTQMRIFFSNIARGRRGGGNDQRANGDEDKTHGPRGRRRHTLRRVRRRSAQTEVTGAI